MKKSYIYAISLIALFIIFMLILIISPIFNIKTIEINDLTLLNKDEIIESLSLNENTNLLFFNKFKASQILKNNRYIKSFSIKKSYPSTLIINIEEKTLIGYVSFLNNYLYIDNEGYVIDIKSDFTQNLPLITGLDFDNFNLGEILPVTNTESLEIAVKFAELISSKDFGEDVITIDLSDTEEIHLYIKNIDVVIGDETDLNIKLNTLIEIINNMPTDQKGILYLDNLNIDPIFKLLT